MLNGYKTAIGVAVLILSRFLPSVPVDDLNVSAQHIAEGVGALITLYGLWHKGYKERHENRRAD